MSKTILFQAIQFSINTQFSSIWPIDRTPSGATTLGQRGPGSEGNKGVLRIAQSSSITGISQSDCLVSYLGHSLGGGLSYPHCREAVDVFYSCSRLGKLLSGLLWHKIVVLFISQIGMFENYSYSIGPCAKTTTQKFTLNAIF